MKIGLLCALILVSLAPVLCQKIETAPQPGTETPAPKKSADDLLARATTKELAIKYTLNADQTKQMYTVQTRKLRSLNTLTPLKTFDPALYRQKLQALQTKTWASIRRILKTKEQVQLYKKTQTDLQTRRTERRQELLRQNADRTAVEIAVLEVYAE